MNGGAAVVSFRLMNALNAAGEDASMLVVDKQSGSETVVSYADALRDKSAFLAERLQIFLQNGFSRENLFKVDTADFGRDISAHRLVKEADVIMLNWINQGALSLDCIRKLCETGKPVVWTMHDMWECTGICHHAYGCERYKESCGKCMYLQSSSPGDLSHRSWKRKKELFSMPNLHFVAVSNWLAGKCHESSILAGKNIEVIPNTNAIDEFSAVRKPNGDYGIPDYCKVLVMGAARLDDPIKGFPMLVESLKVLKSNMPHIAEKVHLLLFGGIRNESLLEEIPVSYTYLGKIDSAKVKEVYSHADVVLSSSHYETLPGTLIEGLASGCVAVTYGNGGQADIVEHMATGYIAQYKSAEDFARGIEWAANVDISRDSLHAEMEKRFSAASVVSRYLNYLRSL